MLTVLLAALLLATLGGGCASMVSNATSDLADSLSASILSHDDPETVRQGAPAYLLMIDSLIARDPDNPELLLAGARLYGSYSGAFVQDPERARTLSARARDYGLRALCTVEKGLCRASSMPYPELEQAVAGVGSSHVPQLYGAAAAWATWVQARRDDWVAVADKARVEVMMQRVLDLDEGYLDGSAHLYLGVLDLLLPGALGGRPEQGRQHLERAIELAPDEPENTLFLAEALLEHRPRRGEEARALLGALAGREPRPDHLLEDTVTLARAREILAAKP